MRPGRRGGVVLAGLVVALVGAALDRRGLGPWGADPADALLVGALALVGGGALLTLVRGRRVRGIGGMLATAGLVPAVAGTVAAVDGGLPGVATGVFGVGLAVAFLGALARVAGPDRPAPSAAGTALALGGAAVVTAAVALLAALLVVEAPVRATTAAPIALAAIPGRPSEVAWRWSAGETVTDVRAAGAGVVVATTEGIVALDGTDGRERWRFARTEARLAALATSPDRRTVVALHTAQAGVTHITVLDALTGRRRWEATVPGTRAPLLTDTVLVTPHRDGRTTDRLDARDLATGALRWTWDPPAGCDLLVIRAVSTPSVVPVQTSCADGTEVLRGLDDTGREVWATTLSTATPDGYPTNPGRPPVTTPDGQLLVASTSSGYALVDPATGAVRATLPPGFARPDSPGAIVLVDGEPDRAVALVDGAGTVTPLPAGCAGEQYAGAVDGSVVRLCRTERGVDAAVDGGPLLDADLAGVRRDGAVALDPLRDEFVVPAPGAVVVAVADRPGVVVGLR